MALNNFFINVFIRVTFIVLSCVVLGIVLQHLDRGYYYTLIGMIFLILLQAYLLVNQVNKTNTDLEKFFSSVQDHDSSVRFPAASKNSSFRIRSFSMLKLKMREQAISCNVWLTMLISDYYHLI
jgi:hypothetical protein